MSSHQEIAFEDDICAHLATHGWRYEPGDAQRYDRAHALFPPDLIAWIQETQPAAWASLTKTHGAATEAVLLDRIRKQLDDRGTLDLLRHGVEVLGLRKPLQLAQFRPALAMNPALEARYRANRLRVLDDQLADAIFGFERTAGVVAVITRDSGSKSGELAKALAGGKTIVVCTIQTFPFAIQAVRELAATQGKRFAVIADEAHSSQTGEAAARLREVLSAQELAELADGGEVGTEDLLAAQMTARAGSGCGGKESGITYIAFTATPKAKAMVVVGSRVEAVRWQLATSRYIRNQGYGIGVLVAFSGEVSDPESGPDPFTERSLTLTATPPSRSGRSFSNACCRSWISDGRAKGWICRSFSSPTMGSTRKAGGTCRSRAANGSRR